MGAPDYDPDGQSQEFLPLVGAGGGCLVGTGMGGGGTVGALPFPGTRPFMKSELDVLFSSDMIPLLIGSICAPSAEGVCLFGV